MTPSQLKILMNNTQPGAQSTIAHSLPEATLAAAEAYGDQQAAQTLRDTVLNPAWKGSLIFHIFPDSVFLEPKESTTPEQRLRRRARALKNAPKHIKLTIAASALFAVSAVVTLTPTPNPVTITAAASMLFALTASCAIMVHTMATSIIRAVRQSKKPNDIQET